MLISSTNTDNNYFWFSIEKQAWINTYDIQSKYKMYGTSQLKPITELGTEFPQTTNQLSLVMEVPTSEKLYLKKSTEAVIGDEKVKLKTKDGHVQGYSDIHETLYEYKIANTGETKIIAPTILQNVYYNASGGLSQVDEQTPSGFETLQGASSVLLEIKFHGKHNRSFHGFNIERSKANGQRRNIHRWKHRNQRDRIPKVIRHH